MLNGLRYCVLENRSDWQLANSVQNLEDGTNLELATSQMQVTSSQPQKKKKDKKNLDS